MTGLGIEDTRYYAPLPWVLDYINGLIKPTDRVLEIGSGVNNFSRANISIDMVPSPNVPKERMILWDVAKQPLPFPDKVFDFVYCRQTLEDMNNPFLICDEMSRVAKAGYIECPSPMAELCRGIDLNEGGPAPWKGYAHHKFVVWNVAANNQLMFLSKFPLIEYLTINDADIVAGLRDNARYWNTHYLWTDKINWTHIQDLPEFRMPQDYPSVLTGAIGYSAQATDAFYLRFITSVVKG